MKAYITHDGEILAAYNIRNNEPIEADHWARIAARELYSATVEQCCDKPRHYVPCGGDFTVTVAEPKDGAFGASCWQERNYYLDNEPC